MSNKLLKLIVITPENIAYNDKITSIVVPAYQGYLGVLYNHAPLICQLNIGKLKIKTKEGKVRFFAIAGGLMKVRDNTIIILTSACESQEEIDLQRAEQALSRAKERLKAVKDTDIERAQAALLRALNRIKTAQRQ